MATSMVPEYGRKAFPAGSASLAQFQFVAFNGSGQLITPGSAGIFAVVLDDAPSLASSTLANELYSGGYTVGRNYGCVFSGVQKVISGAGLTVGTAVKTDTSGHAVAASSGGDVILGWTLATCNSGDLVQILLDRGLHN